VTMQRRPIHGQRHALADPIVTSCDTGEAGDASAVLLIVQYHINAALRPACA
jgi:hypothetical protein